MHFQQQHLLTGNYSWLFWNSEYNISFNTLFLLQQRKKRITIKRILIYSSRILIYSSRILIYSSRTLIDAKICKKYPLSALLRFVCRRGFLHEHKPRFFAFYGKGIFGRSIKRSKKSRSDKRFFYWTRGGWRGRNPLTKSHSSRHRPNRSHLYRQLWSKRSDQWKCSSNLNVQWTCGILRNGWLFWLSSTATPTCSIWNTLFKGWRYYLQWIHHYGM